MEDLTKIVSICVATVNRPYCIQRFVNSVRLNFPAIPIVVANQNKRNRYLEAFFEEKAVKSIYVAEDAGVAVARNAAVSVVDTEYVLICDDDFIFSRETLLGAPLKILAHDKEIDIVGGAVTDIIGGIDAAGWNVRRWEEFFYRDKKWGHLITACIDSFSPIRREVDGIPYFLTDSVLNWKVVRRSAFDRGARWDPRYKCNGEHEDFYLNIKENTELGVAYCPQFQVYHHTPQDFSYQQKRELQSGWKEFSDKWGIQEILEVDDNHHRAILQYGHFRIPASETADPSWGGRKTFVRSAGKTFGPLESDTWPASPGLAEPLAQAPGLSIFTISESPETVEVKGGSRFSIMVGVGNRTGKRIGCFGPNGLSLSYRVKRKGYDEVISQGVHVSALNHDLMQGVTLHVVNICADWDAHDGEVFDLEIDLLSHQGVWLHRPAKATVVITQAGQARTGSHQVVVNFSEPQTPDHLTSFSGLAQHEDWGRWSDANLSEAVTLRFIDALPSKFRLELTCRAYGPNAGHPVMVQVDEQVRSFWPGQNIASHSLEFALERPARIITITPSSPASPASRNESADLRRLGIGLAELKITPIGEDVAAAGELPDKDGQLANEFWENLYAQEDPWGYKGPYEQEKYERTLGLLPEGPIGRALEIGCAEGLFSEMLAPRVGELLGIDRSDRALSRARNRCQKYANTSFACQDISHGFPPGTFDLIVCSEVLYYMQDLFALKKFVRKTARSLAANGYLLMANANSVNDDRNATGFDFSQIGAVFIGEAFAEELEFELLKEFRTPLYRIHLFRRRAVPMAADTIALEQRKQAREVIEGTATFEHPLLKRGGCVVTDAEARYLCDTGDVPILMYHGIARDAPEGLKPWRLSPEQFEQQLAYLHRHAYSTVSVEKIWKMNAEPGSHRRPGKWIALTFGDGYEDFADVAWPLLRRYGFSATVFAVTDHAGGCAEWDRAFGEPAPLMSWDTMRRLAKEGVRFGSHSCSHPHLTSLSRKALMNEVAASREAMARELGAAPSGFCFPFTDYNNDVLEAVEAAGYDYALAGPAEGTRSRFALPRIEINNEDLDSFIAKIPPSLPSSQERQDEYRRLRSLRDLRTYPMW